MRRRWEGKKHQLEALVRSETLNTKLEFLITPRSMKILQEKQIDFSTIFAGTLSDTFACQNESKNIILILKHSG